MKKTYGFILTLCIMLLSITLAACGEETTVKRPTKNPSTENTTVSNGSHTHNFGDWLISYA